MDRYRPAGARTVTTADTRPVRFGGLIVPTNPALPGPSAADEVVVGWAERLLRPVDGRRGAGPGSGLVVDLFGGSGHVGLEVARRTGREVVLADHCPTACRLARTAAAWACLEPAVEVRCELPDELLELEQPVQLAVVGTPVPCPDGVVHRHGGPDPGPPADPAELVRRALRGVVRHLAPGGDVLLRLRGRWQPGGLGPWLATTGLPLVVVQEWPPGSVDGVARVRFAPGARPGEGRP